MLSIVVTSSLSVHVSRRDLCECEYQFVWVYFLFFLVFSVPYSVLHSRAHFSYKFYDLMGFASASLYDPFQSHQQHFTENGEEEATRTKRKKKIKDAKNTHTHTPSQARSEYHSQLALLLKRRHDSAMK